LSPFFLCLLLVGFHRAGPPSTVPCHPSPPVPPRAFPVCPPPSVSVVYFPKTIAVIHVFGLFSSWCCDALDVFRVFTVSTLGPGLTRTAFCGVGFALIVCTSLTPAVVVLPNSYFVSSPIGLFIVLFGPRRVNLRFVIDGCSDFLLYSGRPLPYRRRTPTPPPPFLFDPFLENAPRQPSLRPEKRVSFFRAGCFTVSFFRLHFLLTLFLRSSCPVHTGVPSLRFVLYPPLRLCLWPRRSFWSSVFLVRAYLVPNLKTFLRFFWWQLVFWSATRRPVSTCYPRDCFFFRSSL